MLRRTAIGLVLALLVALLAMELGFHKRLAAAAQYSLGVMYSNGYVVPQSDPEALKWYRWAAEQGHAGAQYNLGFSYFKGQGVPQDYAEAGKWYRKAAVQGLALAQHNLGVLYEKGQGVPQDYGEAVKWYGKAAGQGDPGAYNNYAWLLATNKDPKFRDGEKAVTLALKAVQSKRNGNYLDTLAAAYAEAGKFDEAIRVQKEAVDMLGVSGSKPQLMKEVQDRLNLYKSKKPYRE